MVNTDKFVSSLSFKVDFILPFFLYKEVSFSKISGLSFKINDNDSEDPDNTSLSSGKTEYEPLVLERALEVGKPTLLLIENSLTAWVENQVIAKRKFPIPLIVHALDKKHKPAVSWTFINAVPTNYALSEFDSQGDGILKETFTFQYKRFSRYEHKSLLGSLLTI